MTSTFRNTVRIAILGGALMVTSAGSRTLQAQSQTTHRQATTPAKRHSILKGAVVGAVGGHMTHRRHGALIGAAVGAEVQHHRNKKAAKAMKAKY